MAEETSVESGLESRHRVTAAHAGERLDRLLAGALSDLSRTRLKTLIESGRVTAAGATIADPSYRVKPGQVFEVRVPAPVAAVPAPQEIPLSIVYEDEDVIVLDKPAGLVVHPAAGNRESTLVNALLAHSGGSLSGIGGVLRPGIVHRLDKDTSGLMVVAKNDAAHASLAKQFESRTAGRAYTALIWGVPRRPEGMISGNIGRHPRNRKKMAVVKRGGKPARTGFEVLKRYGDVASLVECRLETGRTHQIRVHMAAFGHPVMGDPLYGGARRGAGAELKAAVARLGRQALHAHLMAFEHPRTHQRLTFRSEIPHDVKELKETLEQIEK